MQIIDTESAIFSSFPQIRNQWLSMDGLSVHPGFIVSTERLHPFNSWVDRIDANQSILSSDTIYNSDRLTGVDSDDLYGCQPNQLTYWAKCTKLSFKILHLLQTFFNPIDRSAIITSELLILWADGNFPFVQPHIVPAVHLLMKLPQVFGVVLYHWHRLD